MHRATRIMMAAAVLATALMAGATAAAQEPVEMVEWPYVGADQAASKYSPLADIDASPTSTGWRSPGRGSRTSCRTRSSGRGRAASR